MHLLLANNVFQVTLVLKMHFLFANNVFPSNVNVGIENALSIYRLIMLFN